MKFIDFNINDYVLVKLTDIGIKELKRRHNELKEACPIIGEFKLKLDDEGYYKSQMWYLIQELGGLINMVKEPPFETNMKIQLIEKVNK